MTSHRIFEGVVQDLRVAIARGRIAAGERLPTERALARQFQVSRASVREAIRILELFGLVTVRRGRTGGVVTTPHCAEIARDSFASLQPLGRHGFQHSLEFRDRKSTRLNSSHMSISYAVFCLKKK